MRKLTIQRKKSFVGCLATMKVYIEDPAGELLINNTPCKKLGDLKNGETNTFEIGEQAVNIYVIGDTMSKDLCAEYYTLPQGGQDLFLSGQNRMDTLGGAFRFHDNQSDGIKGFRKQNANKGKIILIVAAIAGAISGLLAGLGFFSN